MYPHHHHLHPHHHHEAQAGLRTAGPSHPDGWSNPSKHPLLAPRCYIHNNGVLPPDQTTVWCIDFLFCYSDAIVAGHDSICTANQLTYQVLARWCLRLVLFDPFLRFENREGNAWQQHGKASVTSPLKSWVGDVLHWEGYWEVYCPLFSAYMCRDQTVIMKEPPFLSFGKWFVQQQFSGFSRSHFEEGKGARFCPTLREVVKKNGYFTVRLPVRGGGHSGPIWAIMWSN